MNRTSVVTGVVVFFASILLPAVVAGAPLPRARFDQAATPPDVPAEVLIGEDVTFRVRFRNATGGSVGFGPFIDLVLDAGGANINKPGCPCDGITFVQAVMIGVNGGPVPLVTQQTQGSCNPSPSMVTLAHPFSGVLPVVVPAGSQLVTLELPFGSFDATQPEIVIEVTAHVSALADANVPLDISARGGFRYGADALNNAPPDWPVVSDVVAGAPPADQQNDSTLWLTQEQTAPTVLTAAKNYLGPEDETATGPNFPRRYEITVDVAAGHTIQNLTVTDRLPDNLAFVSAVSIVSTPPCFTVASSPVPGSAHSVPNNDLVLQCLSLTGLPGPDAVIVVEFFVPQLDASNQPILLPGSCVFATSVNDVWAEGDWSPADPCDTGQVHISSDVTPADHTLTDKCLAIRKSVVDLSGAPPGHPIPGDTLAYTLSFQLSDFRTARDLTIRDVLSDGQTVTGTMTLTVADQCGTTSGTIPANAITQTVLACTPGAPPPRRELLIDVSQAMAALANPTIIRHSNGVLTGGHALGVATPTGATGTIVFTTKIDDAYQCPVPSPHDQFVDKDDFLFNDVTIDADIATNGGSCSTVPPSAGFPASDDSSVGPFLVAGDTLTKSVHAISRANAEICGPATAPCPASPEVVPFDLVTFRLTKTIPSCDTESITIQDWLPQPLFTVAGSTFSNTICGVPAVGASCFGPANTLNVAPSYSGDPTTNSFTFTYPPHNDPSNQPCTIDLLITRTVRNDPFADGLSITNEAQECESNSFGVTFCQTAIAQVQVREPALKISKGVVAASNPGAVFSPAAVGPVAFTAPGSACPRFGVPITPSLLAATPITSNVANVDANDCVTFAIVVENTGGAPAFDIELRDIYPLGPTDVLDCFAPDFSTLCVRDGTGAALPFTTGGGRSLPIILQNPLPASNASGSNIAILTFDACVLANIEPKCCDNIARVENFASTQGGPDFVDAGFGGPLSDDARLCVIPAGTKSIVDTSEAHTTGSQVAIGEVVRYRLEMTVPESSLASAYRINDQLPAGLRYLGGLTVAPIPGGVSVANNPPLVTAALSCGAPVTFDFGNVTNTNSNSAVEMIAIEFNALVCNIPSNQNTTVLPNSFVMLVNGQPLATSNGVPVTVVEPNLTIVKSGSVPALNPGATASYTITIANNGTATAFDVLLTDVLPACLANLANVQSSVPAANTSTAATLSLAIASIPAGGVVAVQYTATLACTDCAKLTNTARVVWTSLPGPQGTTSNSTGSPTPGASGFTDGERNGAGGVNDYSAAAVATVCCLLVRNAAASCGFGTYTYTFTVTNFSATNVSVVSFTPLTANVTITPSSINTALAPGASTNVTVTIGGSGAAGGANVCFSVALGAPALFCRVDQCVTLPYCCAPRPAGMVAWYPLDEGQGATAIHDIALAPVSAFDNVGMSQPAAIGVSIAPESLPGLVGNSLYFFGGDVEVPDHPELDFNGGSFSIDAWVRPVQCGTTLFATIVDKSDTSSGYSFYVQQAPPSVGSLRLRMNGVVYTSAGTLPANGSAWTHVAVTYDAASQIGRFFVNGAPSGTFTAPSGPVNDSAPLLIGRQRLEAPLCEIGIDEVEVFNRAVPQAQLKAIYEMGPFGKCVSRRRRLVRP